MALSGIRTPSVAKVPFLAIERTPQIVIDLVNAAGWVDEVLTTGGRDCRLLALRAGRLPFLRHCRDAGCTTLVLAAVFVRSRMMRCRLTMPLGASSRVGCASSPKLYDALPRFESKAAFARRPGTLRCSW